MTEYPSANRNGLATNVAHLWRDVCCPASCMSARCGGTGLGSNRCLTSEGGRDRGVHMRMCFRCRASTRGRNNFRHCGPDSEWRGTCFCHIEFMQEAFADKRFISVVFSFPGFGFEFFVLDWMHVVDLGVLLYLQGCVLFEVFREMGGVITSPSKTVDSLCLLLENCSKFIEQKNVPVNKLTFPMIRSKATKCKLKVKATEARRLLPCTLHLIQNIFPPKSDRSRMRLECVSKMRRCFELMDDWSPDSGVEFVMVGRQFLALHSLMCQESREHPSNMHAVWSEYPKHHLMDHLLDDVSSRGNPKESWSYSEESEIGLCAELAGALHPRTVKTMLLQRHRL